MKPETQSLSETKSDRSRLAARRRFLAGSLAVAPLVTTLANRPAWAGACAASAMGSVAGSMEGTMATNCQGQPPEFWRANPQLVEQYVIVGLANPMSMDDFGAPTDYSWARRKQLLRYRKKNKNNMSAAQKQAINDYLDMLKSYPGYPEFPFGTRFQTVFGSSPESELTVMQSLFLEGDQPVCQSACAWLNASYYGEQSFGYGPDQVVDKYHNLDTSTLLAYWNIMNYASLTA